MNCEKKEILKKRLIELGIDEQKIIDEVFKETKPETILLYTSHLEGLGTPTSDIDCYVISRDGQNVGRERNLCRIKFFSLGKAVVDLELYTPEQIQELYSSIENYTYTSESNIFNLNLEILKALHKINLAIPIYGNIEWEKSREKRDISTKLNKAFSVYYRYDASANIEDAIKFFNNKEYEGTLLLGKLAIHSCILSYMASKGVRVAKKKWLWRKCQLEFGENSNLDLIIKRFLLGSEIKDLKKESEDLLETCQDLVIQSQL